MGDNLKKDFLKSRKNTVEGQIRKKTGDHAFLSPREEKAFDKATEKHFSGHRLPESGKNCFYHNMGDIMRGKKKYNDNYDQINWNTKDKKGHGI